MLKFGQTSGREEKNLPVPLAALGVCGGEFGWFRKVAIVLHQLLNVFKYSHKMTNAILRTAFFWCKLVLGCFPALTDYNSDSTGHQNAGKDQTSNP